MTSASDAFETWTAAESPTVQVSRLAWAELDGVAQRLQSLRQAIDISAFADRTVGKVLGLRRLLISAPLAPDHEMVGIPDLIDSLLRFVAEHGQHTLVPDLIGLMEALEQLRASTSPLTSWTVDTVSAYGERPDGRPEALIVVPRKDLVAPTLRWLQDEDLTCVDVATPAELRADLRTHLVALMFGHPTRVYSSQWKAPEDAAREHGWLFTAPPASTVRIALTMDAPRLTPEDLVLLPEHDGPRIVVHDSGPQAPILALREWTAPDLGEGPELRMPRPAEHLDDDAGAVQFRLVSGHYVHFHESEGPRPAAVLLEDSGALHGFTAPRVRALNAGVLLALRVGDAQYDQLISRADAWLRDRRAWTPERIANARASAAYLKDAARAVIRDTGFNALRQRLARSGVESDYARNMLVNLLHEHYIAPRRLDAFEALARAVGAGRLVGEFDELVGLRIAHQQAGEQIRRDSLATLSDTRWVEQVEESGWHVLDTVELGNLLLSVVAARSGERVAISRHLLGAPLDSSGRPVTSLQAATSNR